MILFLLKGRIKTKPENIKLYELVKEALKQFNKHNDSELLDRGGMERTIAFRLGHYMQRILEEKVIWDKGWDKSIVVDAEFNKNGNNPKEVYLNCKHQLDGCLINDGCFIKTDMRTFSFKELENSGEETSNRLRDFVMSTSNSRYMIPDLIIHKRMRKGNYKNYNYNLLALEIKVNRDETEFAKDYAKLTYLTCPASNYQYCLGLFMDFSNCSIAIPEITAFEDGKIVNLPDAETNNAF